MNRVIRWYDYITVNIYWLGLTTLSQTCGLVFPLLIQGFVCFLTCFLVAAPVRNCTALFPIAPKGIIIDSPLERVSPEMILNLFTVKTTYESTKE